MELITLVAMAAIAEYLFFTVRTGGARVRVGLPAPQTSGNEEFERYFRVQQNTLEQLVVFLPALFAAGWYANTVFAVVVGVAFIVGRMMYYVAYVESPEKRTAGMLITFLANGALLLGAIVGALLSLF